MTVAVTESTRRLSVRQSHGRVINEIAAMFRKRLTVPHIFVKPRIPGPTGVDVLAVDRGGSGDIHGVEIRLMAVLPTRTGIRQVLAPLKTLPVHFKYIAVQTSAASREKLVALREYDEFFDSTGIGRIGVITFDERLLQKNATFDPGLLTLLIEPERYLLRGEKLAAVEKYLLTAQPDISVRI